MRLYKAFGPLNNAFDERNNGVVERNTSVVLRIITDVYRNPTLVVQVTTLVVQNMTHVVRNKALFVRNKGFVNRNNQLFGNSHLSSPKSSRPFYESRNLTVVSQQNHNIMPSILFYAISPIIEMTLISDKHINCQKVDRH